MRWTFHCRLLLGATLLCACAGRPPAAGASPSPGQEIAAAPPGPGWRSLFDGRTTSGWRGFRLPAFPEKGWSVAEGTLRAEPGSDQDIITEGTYSSFELRVEFLLSPGANSGIKYLVDEALVSRGHHGLGFEYQLIDDDRHPDAKQGRPGTRACAGLYDLLPPAADKPLRPPGEWNEAIVRVTGDKVEHLLNGVAVLEFRLGSPELAATIAGSKYKTNPAFGTPRRGHILLQAHGDQVTFRNIAVRDLQTVAYARPGWRAR